MPRGVLWFIFNLQIKNRISYTYTYSTVMIIDISTDSFFSQIASYILEKLGVGSTIAKESILDPFLKQTEFFHSPHGVGCLAASQKRLGLAVLAWLA
jgi:hypothetical protein